MKWIFRNSILCIAVLSFSAQGFAKTTHHKYKDQDQLSATNSANWFVSVGAGGYDPNLDVRNMYIANGSGFPPPFDQDTYSTTTKAQPIVALSVGRRWSRPNQWFPAFSLALSYQHLLAEDVGNTIMQYSDPVFTNYNYSLDVSSNVLLGLLKLNIVQLDRVSPYLLAGAGAAYNRTSNYSESPLPGLTASRVSPGFASRTSSQLAYTFGAGLDIQVTKKLLLSAEYQYENLGSIKSGSASGTWSGQFLNLGTYHVNTILVNATYLFDS